MGSRQKVVHRITKLMGQASGYNPEAIAPEKARLLYNFYIQNGIAKKIPGSTLYIGSPLGSSPIVWMDAYKRRLMYQLGSNVSIETAEGAQVGTLLSSEFSEAPLLSDKWQDKIYLANGYDLKYYNDSALIDLGLLPPGEGKTPRQIFDVSLGGAGSMGAGTYKYTVTFFDSESQTESLPIGALVDEQGIFVSSEFDAEFNPLGWLSSTPLAVGGSGSAIISFSVEFRNWLAANLPSRVTGLNLYRAVDTGSGYGDYRLVTTFPRSGNGFNLGIQVTQYTDSALQADLGEILLSEDKIPPPTRRGAVNSGADDSARGPKFIRFWRDSLFLFGSSFPQYDVTDSFKGVTNRNFPSRDLLYGSDTSLPEYFLFNWEIGSGDGQEPTGLAIVNNNLVMFKESSIYVLDGTVLNDFVPKIQDETRGCIAPGSLQETPYGAMFLSSAGIAIFRGTGSSLVISDEILDEIQNINRNALANIRSSYDKYQEIYTIYVPSGTTTQNNRFLQYSLKDQAWSVGRRSREISSATIIEKEDGPQKTLIATNVGGFILDISNRQNVSDYDGDRITAIYRSSDFDFGNREQQKKVNWLYLKAQCGVNWIVDISIYADDGQSAVYEAENINSESDIALYAASETDPDGAVYDEGRYAASQTSKKLKIPISGIGRDFYIEVIEKSNNSDRNLFDILSIEIEATLLGK